MLAAICPPSAPPIVRMIVFIPVATPVSVCDTASTIRFAIAAKDRPMPTPSNATPNTTCQTSACISASQRNDTEATAVPSSTGTREPTRVPIQPENGPATSIAKVDGNMTSPAPVTEKPNPYPVASGVWTSCGVRMNEPNIPKPTSIAVRLVVHTPRRRIIRMSTSGWSTRVSHQAQTTSTTAAPSIRPTVRAESQPQLLPSLTASSSAASPVESSPAPAQSIFAGARTGDSGTYRRVATTEAATTTNASQKIHS